jgi:hypothetical protein
VAVVASLFQNRLDLGFEELGAFDADRLCTRRFTRCGLGRISFQQSNEFGEGVRARSIGTPPVILLRSLPQLADLGELASVQ